MVVHHIAAIENSPIFYVLIIRKNLQNPLSKPDLFILKKSNQSDEFFPAGTCLSNYCILY